MCPDPWIPTIYFPENGCNCNSLNVVVANSSGTTIACQDIKNVCKKEK
jgi:hypothetical protein